MKLQRYILLIFLLLLISALQAQTGYFLPAENYGGKQALKDLLRLEMVYPEDARKNGEQGTVVIKFTVNRSGKAEDVVIAESVSENVDREARRLFDHILWTPAKSKGTTVDQKMEIEFKFKLKKYDKNVKHRGYDQIEYPFEPVDKSLVVYKHRALDSVPKPVYPNMDMKFSDFIIQHLSYPDEAKKQGIQGTVDLFFVVEPSGNVTNYKVEQGVGGGCSEESIRLLHMLHWYPGIKDGKAVRTAMKLSITFNLENSENMKYVPANNANQI